MSDILTPAISIVVPVYNAAPYIRRCLQSIQNQSFSNWEAILVNDGSTDESGNICEEYALHDNRFKVVHKSNGGVSSARQTGIEASKGEFLIHTDPDDWMDNNMLSELIGQAKKNNADVVLCGFQMHTPDGIAERPEYVDKDTDSSTLQRLIINGSIHGSCWNKLIRRDCIGKTSFTPQTITYCEDLLFNVRLLNNKNLKISYVPKMLYHYDWNNNNSISHEKSVRLINSLTTVICEINKLDDSLDTSSLKRTALFQAFISKEDRLLSSLYKEEQSRIVDSVKYNIFTPNISCLKIALQGHPKSARLIYRINISAIRLKNWIQDKLSKRK